MNDGSSRRGINSPQSVTLIAVALGISLVLGTAFVLIEHFRPSVSALDRPAQPLTDGQTMAQVMEPAKQIVAVARLQAATGGYTLMSCRNLHDPPYQGEVYLNFRLPGTSKADTIAYLDEVSDALRAAGWAEGLPENQHLFGHTLTKNRVTAIFYPNADQANFATMQIYGECRNTTDHTNDSTAWTDVTDELR